jgi:penicillin-binding protein 1A
MKTAGYLTEAAYNQAVATPLKVAGLKRRATRAPYFVEWVKQQLVDQFGETAVYRGGLRVKTTLDPAAQSAAEKAIKSSLDRKGDPSAALVSLKPKTGEILAMVGGRDFAKQQYNVADQGKRQPGSAYKPFVLVTALEQGVSPEKVYKSGPVKLNVGDSVWRVTGAHSSGKGAMRLRPATEQSVNSVFAQLILDVGADEVVKTAEKLGISKGIEPVPAIALGGLEHGVSPLDMANAYATLASGGRRSRPYGIASVRSADGEYLLKTKPKSTAAVDPAVAYLATDILRGVIARGTGTSAQIGRPAAGKTGTTQEYRDAWFVGYP